MATEQSSTNIVPITSAPNYKPAPGPRPLEETPELALIDAILDSLPRKQRLKIRRELFAKRMADDVNAQRAHFHTNGLV